MEKKCFKCGKIKQIGCFYAHNKMPDGHLNKCKTCAKSDSKDRYNILKNDEIFLENERKRGRSKHQRLYSKRVKPLVEYSESISWKIRFPEKVKAKSILGHKNKKSGYHRHHWSYNEQHYCDIIHLTLKEHFKAHRFLVYDTEHLMYRRFDDMTLLDTKDKHFDFINYCIKNLGN